MNFKYNELDLDDIIFIFYLIVGIDIFIYTILNISVIQTISIILVPVIAFIRVIQTESKLGDSI
jgi:hypothetical protein